MGNTGRRLAASAAFMLVGLLFAAPAVAMAPGGAVKIAGVTSFGKAIPYGRSRLLLLDANSGGSFGMTRVNLNGSIDTSFGRLGTVHMEAAGAVVAPDGKIIVADTVRTGAKAHGLHVTKARVTRLLPDGRLDRTFGRDGSTEIRFGLYGDGTSVALAANGDILLVGNRVDDPRNTYVTEFDLGVARLKPNGAPDRTFGHRGAKIIPVGDEIVARQIAATPSGGILVEERNSIDASLLKLDQNGTPDHHFGHDGYLYVEGRRNRDGHRQLLLPDSGFAELADGRILVTATGSLRSGSFQNLVGRYRADGSTDRSWGNDGWAVVPGDDRIRADGLTPLPGGRVAVNATDRASAVGGADFGAVVLDRRGRLDRGFAVGGTCRVRLPGRQSAAGVVAVGGRAVVLGGDGKTTTWLRVCPRVP
jgi:uncharacterized delta-60 repeat protein